MCDLKAEQALVWSWWMEWIQDPGSLVVGGLNKATAV